MKGNGEGTVYYDDKRKRYRASYTVGYDPVTNKVKRKSFSGKTKIEAVEKMEA